MSNSNRRAYLTATVLDQALLDACHDNLECKLEMVCEIETPDGVIYASDRNKYVGERFYEALLKFPVISRTVGEWLSNELQFSTLTLSLSNVDGRFNKYLQGGASYAGWVGKSITVSIGLAEQASTYVPVFRGKVTPVGGFKRNVKAITLIARDQYDQLNDGFPTAIFKAADYPKMEPQYLGKIIPIIYGDYRTATEPVPAAIPAYPVNGHDPFVHFEPVDVALAVGVATAQDHDLDALDQIQFETDGSLPSPLVAGINYYVRNPTADTFQVSILAAGALIAFSGPQSGSHKFKPGTLSTRENVRMVVAGNDLFALDGYFLKRNDTYYQIPATEIVNIGTGNRSFEIKQDGLIWVDTEKFLFTMGDEFAMQLRGKDLGAYSSNYVWIARDMLMTYGGLSSGDFDANFATFRDSTPALCRAYIDETKPLFSYVNSMLEQVLLETFPDRNLRIKINSLRFADWPAVPDYVIKNWDIERDSFNTSIDERNNFNRVQGVYNLLPNVGEEARSTAVYRNDAAIAQAGIAISKKIAFPNMYRESDVVEYLTSMLELASSTLEKVSFNLTWRSLRKDVGDFVCLDAKIGSAIYDNAPVMLRFVGYDPQGPKLVCEGWSMQMVPYPGWAPGYAGIVGGDGAAITQE